MPSPARFSLATSLLSGMDADERLSFTASQLAAIDRAATRRPTRHSLDYRVSLPWFTGPGFYVVVLAGRERRNPGRLAAEGQTDLDRQSLAFLLILLLLGIGASFGLVVVLYVAKSLLGIDLSPGDSILHPLYDIFG